MNNQGTILIADDDAHARHMLQLLLAREGHALLFAGSGDEALRQAAEHLPDLILLDIMMPGIDGFEVCRQIRDTPQLREIPILMVTSLDNGESRLRGLTVGADGFITKPFDRAELLAQIRTITRLNRYRRLLAQQARFERPIQLSPDGIAIVDAGNHVLLANQALATLLAVESEEHLVGQSIIAYILPDIVDRYYATLTATAAQRAARAELALLTRQGQVIPVEVSIGRLDGTDGAYAEMIVRDITERKQAEAQIQRQVSQLTSLYAIGVTITASLDLNDTLSLLLDRIVEELGVDAASVLLLNPRTRLLDLAASRGLGLPADQQVVLRPDEGLAGVAYLSRRPVSAPAYMAEDLRGERDRALATMFASYFALPLQARGEVKGVLEIMHRTHLAPDHHWWVFLEALSVQAAIAIDTAALFSQLQRANAELRHAYDATIEGWSRALDLRDEETEGHSARVTELSLQLARRMNVSPEDLEHIRRGALLHDIGKMGVPDRILLKPGPLTAEEWDIMRKHPAYAYTWLAPISFLQPALAIPYAHHERWDGSGYPRGLCGEQIPLAARIFAVVDVWDALRSNRPYRTAWSEEHASAYIKSLSGTHFDPQVVEAFLELLRSTARDDAS